MRVTALRARELFEVRKISLLTAARHVRRGQPASLTVIEGSD
jgi:hypothetical protein